MQLYWGFSRKFYISCVLFVQFWAFPTAYIVAKPQNSVTISQQAVTEKTKAEDNKTKAKTANKSVAQGLSVAESMLLNESPWGFFFNATAERGLDEFADTWSSVNTLSLSYRLDSKSALGLNLGYETVLYEKGGQLFNNVDNDPGRFGMQDLNVTYTRPKIWSDKYNSLVWSSALNFPASRASQRNSLVVEGTTGLALRYRPNQSVIITPSVGTYYRQFRYETANVFGTQANSPFGFRYGLAGSYVFNKWFIGSASYGITRRYDFFKDWTNVQSGTVALTVNATDVLNISAGYNWRDRIVTNEPLFDDDRSIFFIGVGYVF